MKTALAVLALLLTGCDSGDTESSEFVRYKHECESKGGYTTMTHGATWSMNARFQCQNDKGALMPEITW